MKPHPFHSITDWQHEHDFFQHNHAGERNTKIVLLLTLLTMMAEIVAGSLYGSMALLADGWHMGTHAAAFILTLFAYHYAVKHKDNPAFAFGTGKVGVLGGFTSAIVLGVVALLMIVESVSRLFSPSNIAFSEAILVAVIGLSVNLLSAFLLKDHHHHHDHHEDDAIDEHNHLQHGISSHDHEHHHDHNLRAAYLHVLADALTSVLAIVALLAGKFMGLVWLDPVIGIVGALIIARWAWGLMRDTAPVLLDSGDTQLKRQQVRALVASEQDHGVTDLHIWQLSPQHFACILAVVSHQPQSSEHFARRLKQELGFAHVTVEVHRCECGLH